VEALLARLLHNQKVRTFMNRHHRLFEGNNCHKMEALQRGLKNVAPYVEVVLNGQTCLDGSSNK